MSKAFDYYLQSSKLLPTYRPHHSTETAMLRVISDLLQFVDQGYITVLVIEDLTSAFFFFDGLQNHSASHVITDHVHVLSVEVLSGNVIAFFSSQTNTALFELTMIL